MKTAKEWANTDFIDLPGEEYPRIWIDMMHPAVVRAIQADALEAAAKACESQAMITTGRSCAEAVRKLIPTGRE